MVIYHDSAGTLRSSKLLEFRRIYWDTSRVKIESVSEREGGQAFDGADSPSSLGIKQI